MNKRLLAGLMALCLAAGAANAAFAEDPPLPGPLRTEITATGETAAAPAPPGDEEPAATPTPTPAPIPDPTATPEMAARAAPRATVLTSVEIKNHIETTGELVAVVNGESAPVDGVQYTWYRSKTGADGSWTEITAQ